MSHPGAGHELCRTASSVGPAVWIALATGASVAFSLMLACAMPFAAVATIGAIYLPRRHALWLTLSTWLANQAVGYALLGYPRTPDSFGWGLAIGVAALAATVAAGGATQQRLTAPVALGAALASAFAAYEVVLLAATILLPSGEGAFAPGVILQLLGINVLALLGLLALHRAGMSLRLLSPSPAQAAA